MASAVRIDRAVLAQGRDRPAAFGSFEQMPLSYCLQQWFNLSDPAT